MSVVSEKEFGDLVHFLKDNYEDLKNDTSGKVADYIEFLKHAPVTDFGISIHTVDNRSFGVGDFEKHATIQSCVKPFLHCIACEKHTQKYVENFIAHEPSGAPFNSHKLKKISEERSIPFNPMVNAGAIMSISLLFRGENLSSRFNKIENVIKKTCGNVEPGFNNKVAQSEKEAGDSNRSVIFSMRHMGSFNHDGHFPNNAEVEEILDLYFQSCSITINAKMGATMAGTLANGGICPFTDERVFSTGVVESCLANMFFSGMYTSAGNFGHEVQLPAKSGVGGFLMLVVPGKFGLCIYSPPLDVNGNCVRGVELCKRLVSTLPYNYGFFRNNGIINNNDHLDIDIAFTRAMTAIVKDDFETLRKYVDTSLVNMSDYDGRTLLHVACSYGKPDIIEYLLKEGANTKCTDYWANTPMDDIQRFIAKDTHTGGNNEEIINRLQTIYESNVENTEEVVEE